MSLRLPYALRVTAPGWLALALVSPARAESPRIQAESALRELEAQANPARALTQGTLQKARQALTRAKNARQAGDHPRASLLEALARELTETARDLVRVRAAEQRTAEIEKQALEAETRVVRARALVELAAARRGRAQEQLEQVEASRAPARSPAPAAGRGKP